jgi:hypothetical protein
MIPRCVNNPLRFDPLSCNLDSAKPWRALKARRKRTDRFSVCRGYRHVAAKSTLLLASDRGWSGLGVGLRGPLGLLEPEAAAQERGERPPRPPAGVTGINPRNRMPVSLIIDDSTCLVNLAHFAIPQFQAVFPDQYLQTSKTLPREIPDAFVRRFEEWCGARGIKGKYSVVPYPV